MSEPVSNVEIEDVLSSIRRLVSEENRPTTRSEKPVEAAQSGRLVLTPALRVAEPPAAPPLTLIDPVVVGDTVVGDTAVETPVSDLRVVEELAGIDLAPEHSDLPAEVVEDAETDAVTAPETTPEMAAEPELAALPDNDPDSAPALSDQTDAPENDSENDGEDAPWRDPNATLFQAADQPAEENPSADEDTVEPISEPVETAGQQGDETPEASDEVTVEDTVEDTGDLSAPDPLDPLGATFEERFPLETPDEDTSFADSAFEEPTLQDACAGHDAEIETLASSGSQPDTATLSAKIAALEATIGQTLDQWEPDGDSRDEYAGTPVETIQWQDHTATSAGDPAQLYPELPGYTSPPGADAPAAGPEDDSLDAMTGNDTFLDEESLRELVADIVREELQGVLGERITRNVRKLVRREIHRAFALLSLIG